MSYADPPPPGHIHTAKEAGVTAGNTVARPIYPPPDAPLEVARKLYKGFRDAGGLRTLVCWRGSWMTWTGQHWTELDTAHLRSTVYKKLGAVDYERPIREKGIVVDHELVPWNPTKIKVGNVLEAMAAVGHLPADVDAPAWIGVHTADSSAAEMISCTNGLLNLSTRTLADHTPALFNTVSVPFDYDADAPEPRVWLTFMSSVWTGDPDSIALLQEFVGYVLSGRTDMQKMLLLIGPTRSGKGTISRGVTNLVGRGHVTGPTLASLGTNFGLAPLLGKPLGIIADARLGSTPAHTIVERLLSITGEDLMTVDRKFRDPWSGKLPTRLIVLSNELPRFSDASGAIANRMLILQMTNSFLGREDRTLDRRLAAELPGILNWALEGLDRLTRQGRFTVPQSSTEAATLLMDLASPVSAFVRDCCVRKPDERVGRDALFDAWKTWAEDNGHQPGAKSTFGRNLRAVVPEVKDSQPRIGGVQVRQYQRIGLIPAHQRDASYALNGFAPVSSVSGNERPGQQAGTDAGDAGQNLFRAQSADLPPTADTGHPALTGGLNAQLNGADTGDTGQTPFKGQRVKNICPDCQRAPARGDTGLCDFCTVKHRRQQTSDGVRKVPAREWLASHIAGLRVAGNNTVESASVYDAGQAAGYTRSVLASVASESSEIRLTHRAGARALWHIDPDRPTDADPTPAEWVAAYMAQLSDGDVVERDDFKSKGVAAGYSWAALGQAARKRTDIKIESSGSSTTWTVRRTAEESVAVGVTEGLS